MSSGLPVMGFDELNGAFAIMMVYAPSRDHHNPATRRSAVSVDGGCTLLLSDGGYYGTPGP